MKQEVQRDERNQGLKYEAGKNSIRSKKRKRKRKNELEEEYEQE